MTESSDLRLARMPLNNGRGSLPALGFGTLIPDAAETIAYFTSQGVTLKVISGDSPRTVGAVAARAGIPHADDPVDARQLPDDPGALDQLLEERSVFGRVTPHQKQAMVQALQARGHTVAMTGDGVNDVLALKLADLGIAMGSGAAATRAVAELVLLDGRFATLPGVVAEGRRVTANIERVANLFVTKTVWTALLAIAVSLTLLPYPFLPRHLTIIDTLTIGVPGRHNALNATAAAALAASQGVESADIVEALATFKSVKRRLELRCIAHRCRIRAPHHRRASSARRARGMWKRPRSS